MSKHKLSKTEQTFSLTSEATSDGIYVTYYYRRDSNNVARMVSSEVHYPNSMRSKIRKERFLENPKLMKGRMDV